jgi:hypothetical protein
VQLQEQQPEQSHPLAATNDKHAALVLQELQQEVQDAERSKRQAVNHHSSSSPQRRQSDQPIGLKAPGLSDGAKERDYNRQKPPIPPPPALIASAAPNTDGPSFEQKINRILYEQYFYNKAQTNVSPESPRPASLN